MLDFSLFYNEKTRNCNSISTKVLCSTGSICTRGSYLATNSPKRNVYSPHLLSSCRKMVLNCVHPQCLRDIFSLIFPAAGNTVYIPFLRNFAEKRMPQPMIRANGRKRLSRNYALRIMHYFTTILPENACAPLVALTMYIPLRLETSMLVESSLLSWVLYTTFPIKSKIDNRYRYFFGHRVVEIDF